MGERKRKREWSVLIMRHRGEFLGVVEAPDEATAERAAVKTFRLDAVQAKRLLIRART